LRTLLIAALAVTLAGCSRHPPPPLVSTGLCADANRFACLERRPGPPTKLGSARIKSAATSGKSASVRKSEGSSFAYVRHGARLANKTAKPTMPAAKAAAAASRVPPPPPVSSQARPEPARSAAADVNASPANVAEPHPTAGAANSDSGMIEAKVAAARVLAERMTAATATPAPDTKAASKDSADPPSQTPARGDTERTPSASADDADRLVAVLMVRPEIKSVSDLAGKTIAIDDRYSASNGSVRTAIVAAGAPAAQLSEGPTTAINRLVDGEVPAAVLALVSPEAAERFPAIAGFKTFQIPLSPRSLKPRP
jgi:hypothetical protein